MMFKNVIERFSSDPRKLFLIDGMGATLSAFLLGVVLVRLESLFGIPPQALYFLAFLPCIFMVFDLYCYLRVHENVAPFLQAIAYINILYCCLSIGVAFYHAQQLTPLGWAYIIIEILIVILIAVIELKTATRLKARS